MQLRRAIGAAGVLFALLPVLAQAQGLNGYLQRLKAAEAAAGVIPANVWDGARTPENSAALRPFISAMQVLGTQRAFVGDTAGAIAAFDLGPRANKGAISANDARKIDEASVEDAVAAIVAQARTRRVVLINEAHFMPMNRAFSQRLARELRTIGYTYLACETFDYSHPDAFAQGYPSRRGGYYTEDPIFGSWIAEAIADGWKLVAYEAAPPAPGVTPGAAVAERERGEAQNLVDRIFAKDSNAKVMINVGHGHLYKGTVAIPGRGEIALMGEHLRRMTGLDMVHVDQTQYYAHPDRAFENSQYDAMLAKSDSGKPFVLRSKDGSYLRMPANFESKVDMQVIFPRYGFSDANGRPEWLASVAGRTPRDIPRDLLPAKGRRAILAYRVGEPADAVPADIVLVEAGKPAPKLMLPKGEFRFAIED